MSELMRKIGIFAFLRGKPTPLSFLRVGWWLCNLLEVKVLRPETVKT